MIHFGLYKNYFYNRFCKKIVYNLLLLKTNKKITKGPAVTTRNNERS